MLIPTESGCGWIWRLDDGTWQDWTKDSWLPAWLFDALDGFDTKLSSYKAHYYRTKYDAYRALERAKGKRSE